MSYTIRPIITIHQSLHPSLKSAPMPLPDLASAIHPLPLLSYSPQRARLLTPYSSSSAPAAAVVVKRDVSNLHPVFFTERLRRSPLVPGAPGVTSPVAHGYAYQEAKRTGKAIPSML
ncbi:hypothetical protein F4820DRAFT_321568 [Hypoxylon rubiginosum]|uniref:Uncharacterized protein n=1 Tax=Hypoxylon rubiginosum TaxID=110542 RepID=A0ACB9ZF55_9PEZI|nr:hypothetical protein F4820DRAFT_321568 [Hypoxylon rubiginosum]